MSDHGAIRSRSWRGGTKRGWRVRAVGAGGGVSREGQAKPPQSAIDRQPASLRDAILRMVGAAEMIRVRAILVHAISDETLTGADDAHDYNR